MDARQAHMLLTTLVQTELFKKKKKKNLQFFLFKSFGVKEAVTVTLALNVSCLEFNASFFFFAFTMCSSTTIREHSFNNLRNNFEFVEKWICFCV